MLRYRRVTAVGLVAGVLLATPGCSLPFPKDEKPSSAATATSTIAPWKGFSEWTAEKLTEAFAAIDDEIGAHPADYVMVSIGETSVWAQAIDPQKRENVDKYTYQAGYVEVAPVDASDNEPGELEMSKYTSDSVNTAALAQVINSAVKDCGVEDGRLVSVSYYRFSPFDDRPEPQFRGTVYGPRATKSFSYDVTGKLLSCR